MKDNLLNLLVFVVVFCLTYALCAGIFFIYTFLVPGAVGIIFSDSLSFSLIPALLAALLFAFTRLEKTSAQFKFSYPLLLTAFSVVLFLLVPLASRQDLWFQPESFPYAQGRILSSDDGRIYIEKRYDTKMGPFRDQLLGPLVIGYPDQELLLHPQGGQYDPLHHRILIQGSVESIELEGLSPESEYFKPKGFLAEFLFDIKAVIPPLLAAYKKSVADFLVLCVLNAFFWMGLFVFFSIKAFPLVKWTVIFLMIRLFLWTNHFVWNSGLSILDGVLPSDYLAYFPHVFLGLIGMSCFWLILLVKPHQAAGERNA